MSARKKTKPSPAAIRVDKLPLRYYVKLGRERNDDGEVFFYAGIVERPPDGGWETGCDYFGHVPKVHAEGAECGWNKPVPNRKDEECMRWSVSADDPEDLKKRLDNMLKEFVMQPKIIEQLAEDDE